MSDAERLNIILTARDREFTRAMDRNNKLISNFASNTNRGLSNTAKSFDKMGTAAKGSATGLGRVINMSGSGRFVLQNTAAQMGDIAVQMEMGTSASRIMAQQLPQLFGGFGALGGVLGVVAPLLGVVAAVGIPIAAMFMSMGSEAEDSGEKVKTFADYVSEAEGALGRAEAAAALASRGGLVDLEEIYGELTDNVRNLADALADIEMRAAKTTIGTVLDEALGASFDTAIQKSINIGFEVDREQEAALLAEIEALAWQIENGLAVGEGPAQKLEQLRAALALLQGDFVAAGEASQNLAIDDAALASLAEFRADLEAARAAGDFHGVADALSEIRQLLAAAGVEIDQAVIDGLTLAEDQARKLGAELGQAGDEAAGVAEASGGIGPGLDPAIAAAKELARQFGISLSLAQQLNATGYARTVGRGRGGDPRQFGGSAEDWQRDHMGAQVAYQPGGSAGVPLPEIKTPKTRSGGGGRSRKTEAEKEAAKEATSATRKYESAVKALEKAFSDNEARAEGYREKLDALKAQFDGGKISAEEYSAGVDKIKDAFQESARQAKSLEDAAAQTFASIVTGSESASDALSNLFANLANQMAQSAFSGLFGGSEVFAGLGDLISGNFDGGGYTGNAPRAGGLDGKGGFLAMMHPKESVIDHTKGGGGGAASGGGGSVNINVSVSGARGNSEISEMVQNGVRQGLQHYDRSVLPRSVKQINSDPRRIG